LTRRLVDVAQDVIITEVDCKDNEGIVISGKSQRIGEDFLSRIAGRVLAEDIVNKETGEVLLKKGILVTEDDLGKIDESVEAVRIRSVLTCKTRWGLCQKCYGSDLAKGGLIALGEAVGIIAAQSIGEPGTQLTMRTFHAGGVVGVDITRVCPELKSFSKSDLRRGKRYWQRLPAACRWSRIRNRRLFG
jgi:DNA-directed RNA polymerase subunit beta'